MDNQSLKEIAEAARASAEEATAALRQRETEFVKEREDLQRSSFINLELQEFRNSVGGPLRMLLNRVPDRGVPVSSELGAVLLARLHEVIDELESKGIRARPEREARL